MAYKLVSDYERAIKVAASLCDGAENMEVSEYIRGLSELIADIAHLPEEVYGDTLDVRAYGVRCDIRKMLLVGEL